MLATFTYLLGPRKGERQKIEAARITIGRAPDNALAFDDRERRVSAHHAEITRKGQSFVIRDLGSTNGTMINGRRIIVEQLRPDDLIEFGAGGPLVRFGVERDHAANEQAGHLPAREIADDRDVEQASHRRAGNFRLVAAMIAAMLMGAAGGVVLSSRLSAADRSSMSFASVARRNSPAVVFVRVEFELVDSSGKVLMTDARTGSGFVVSAKGLIATNRHLLRDWEYNALPPSITGRVAKIEIVFPGRKREEALPAEIFRLSADKETDVAMLKIDPPADMPVVRGLQTNLSHIDQGDEVAVIGYPLGMDLLKLTGDDSAETSLSVGVVSRVSQDAIQLYLRAYRGNSGGPALNRRGEVIGILTSNVESAQDIAFCVPVSAALELIKDELRDRGEPPR